MSDIDVMEEVIQGVCVINAMEEVTQVHQVSVIDVMEEGTHDVCYMCDGRRYTWCLC